MGIGALQYIDAPFNWHGANVTRFVQIPESLWRDYPRPWNLAIRSVAELPYGPPGDVQYARYKGALFQKNRSGEVWHWFYYEAPSNLDQVLDVVVPIGFGIIAGLIAGPIGTSIIGGEAAASYPLLAQAIGQVAVTTTVNGGDVEAAVTRAAPNLIANYVGGNVAAQVDSAIIGRAASAATAAAIRGDDIDNAIGASLLNSGLKEGSNMFADAYTQQYTADFADYGYGTDAGIVPISGGEIMGPVEPLQDFYGVGDPSQTAVFDYTFGGSSDIGFSSPAPDAGIVGVDIPVYTETPPIVIDDGAPSGFGASALDFLTSAALAAIKVNQAYQATQRPPVRVNTNPASGAPRPTAGGMLVTQNPLTGAAQTARPSVGVPYVLSDGRTMINNGDGTFSLIAANGQAQRIPYGSSGGATDYTQWALFGALGLAAFAFIRK